MHDVTHKNESRVFQNVSSSEMSHFVMLLDLSPFDIIDIKSGRNSHHVFRRDIKVRGFKLM